jgi:hypothetical protein
MPLHLTSTLALTFLLAPTAPATAMALQPTATPRPQRATATVRLRVGATRFDGASVADEVTRRIRDTAERVFAADDIAVDRTNTVIVEITVGPLGEEGYVSNIVVRKDQREVSGTRRDHLACELCTENELITQLEGELQALTAAIRETALGDTTQTPNIPEPEPIPEPEGPELPPAQTEFGTMSKLGVASFVIGAVAVGIGAGVFINGTTAGRDQATSGAVVTGIGAALSVTGAILLILDHQRRERRDHERQTVLAPIYDGQRVGAAVMGRF